MQGGADGRNLHLQQTLQKRKRHGQAPAGIFKARSRITNTSTTTTPFSYSSSRHPEGLFAAVTAAFTTRITTSINFTTSTSNECPTGQGVEGL
jgi:hypothetical protein